MSLASTMKKVVNQSPKMSKKLSLASVGSLAMTGINAYGAYSDFKDAKEEGYGTIGATAKAATSYVAGEVLGLKYLGLQALQAVPKGIVAGAETLGKVERQMESQSRQLPFVNASFNDFNQAFTMRQAGMQAAQQSKYNLQQALLGNEASYLRK